MAGIRTGVSLLREVNEVQKDRTEIRKLIEQNRRYKDKLEKRIGELDSDYIEYCECLIECTEQINELLIQHQDLVKVNNTLEGKND